MTGSLCRAASATAAAASRCWVIASLSLQQRRRQSSTVRTRTLLRKGEQASSTRRITEADLRVFSALCGDHNPVHSSGVPSGPSEDDAADSAPRRVLVHGAFLNALASGVIGTQLPGPGSIVVGQNIRYPRPCLVGEEVTTVVEVKEVRKIVEVTYRCIVNAESDDPKVVLEGNAKLIIASLDIEDEGANESGS